MFFWGCLGGRPSNRRAQGGGAVRSGGGPSRSLGAGAEHTQHAGDVRPPVRLSGTSVSSLPSQPLQPRTSSPLPLLSPLPQPRPRTGPVSLQSPDGGRLLVQLSALLFPYLSSRDDEYFNYFISTYSYCDCCLIWRRF